MNSASSILFRPHSLGDIMSGVKKGWSVEDSLTCKRKLIKIHREIKYSRYYRFSNKYTEKGIKQEGDAITLYCRNRGGVFLKKNTERVNNLWFTGETDVKPIKTESGKETVDLKCSWSLDTFPHTAVDKPDSDYEYQGQAYMDLTESDNHIIAYCLVNAPASLILREKDMLYYKLDKPDQENEEYKQGKIDIEKNMIFDLDQFARDNPDFPMDCEDWQYDIPMKERVVEFSIKRSETEINKIKNRISDCRKWMEINLLN